MNHYQTRPLSPRVLQVMRDDALRQFVDVSGALPSGVTVSSATVAWSQVTGSSSGLVTRTDRTVNFGSPSVEANPTAVPKSGGGTQGGPGWVAFTPDMDNSLPAGEYEMLLRVTLSSGEVVGFSQRWTVSAWGDPDA